MNYTFLDVIASLDLDVDDNCKILYQLDCWSCRISFLHPFRKRNSLKFPEFNVIPRVEMIRTSILHYILPFFEIILQLYLHRCGLRKRSVSLCALAAPIPYILCPNCPNLEFLLVSFYILHWVPRTHVCFMGQE